ncbi:hypothetical protein FMUND_396 [Fusarium mundagurra]|uniref:Uncharacterized protein n=1 Tax=Fusarium mundagurra TaxID=1567541 RepID=A0A8H5Z8P2_9HYPO|nr:hypothetical protein FMUND_396 [Fusarium mundagurra]
MPLDALPPATSVQNITPPSDATPSSDATATNAVEDAAAMPIAGNEYGTSYIFNESGYRIECGFSRGIKLELPMPLNGLTQLRDHKTHSTATKLIVLVEVRTYDKWTYEWNVKFSAQDPFKAFNRDGDFDSPEGRRAEVCVHAFGVAINSIIDFTNDSQYQKPPISNIYVHVPQFRTSRPGHWTQAWHTFLNCNPKMSDFRTRIPCREITSLSKLYDILTNEYGNMYYKLETEKSEQGELFWVVGVSSHFARDVRELLIANGVLRQRERPRGFTAINGPNFQGDSLPEVVDLTGDDSDEETLPAHETTNSVDTPRDLTARSRQRLPDTEEKPTDITKTATNKRDRPERSRQSAVTQIPEQHRPDQRPIATCNSAVGQEDRSTGRIPISMLLEDANPRA